MAERTTKVEVHPASAVLPPEAKRWRVLLDGMQHSVHETEAEAREAEKTLKRRLAGGWDKPQGSSSAPGQSRGGF